MALSRVDAGVCVAGDLTTRGLPSSSRDMVWVMNDDGKIKLEQLKRMHCEKTRPAERPASSLQGPPVNIIEPG